MRRNFLETESQKHYREREKAEYLLISTTNCGRTWLRLLIGRVLQNHYQIAAPDLNLSDLYSFSENNPYIPKIKANHERYNLSNNYKNKKVILLVRDPRDALVSRYMQFEKNRDKYSNLSDYIQNAPTLKNDYIKPYNSFAEYQKNSENLTFIRYEDLRQDTAKELKKVITFLGLSTSDEIINEAVEYASFQNMRKIEIQGSEEVRNGVLQMKTTNNPEGYKVRKGKVGGYRDYLDADAIEFLEATINQELDPIYGYNYYTFSK
ncbi:sulfotransferase domain-containing protein [Spirulina sp. CS-785/01]|uniref:sulfotransferase domain-containing protein n=1 Tax=Spirulina sp. CS-785/01 TaxID=3021716 RepID=UPI00232C8654|nr:sulfotransferase domain-containing protein [Spirulina sp. CS-785/01]MDB9315955.1 sulfotransferase domain-containing protein [Spirulina sp. CS-785/01]